MVITRFAPSPTGYLHIGSVRTALYCWLWTQKTAGKFILRIEDTDRERSTQEAIDVILEGMQWLGLDWDEGPIYQTQRFDRYKEVINQLLADGQAYKCTCSKERLTQLREAQMQNRQKPRYDGHCRNVAHGELAEGTYVVRFKNPEEGAVEIDDAVKGKITIQNKELDDLVILRSDGAPTYNLTVVVDDWDMGVTHVLRGDDHINNTPRQINILHALGADIPIYGHMPMLLGPDNKKLSKRHGAASVLDYRDEGYLPEALVNYLVRLGWSKGDQEIFSLEELKSSFDIHSIHASAGAINPDKLLWLNQHYLKTLAAEDIAERLQPFLERLGADISSGPALTEVVEQQCERCKTLLEMAQKSLFWYSDNFEVDDKAALKHLKESCLPQAKLFVEKLNNLSDWTQEGIHTSLQEVLSELDIKMGKLGPVVRIGVSGSTMSPSIDVTLHLLGRQRTISRLEAVVKKIEK
tara:strand:+ start:2485 stop:3882 length:1398 start_codon:yes stop_codon:yes gene_type:complete